MKFFVGLHKPWHAEHFERACISANVLRAAGWRLIGQTRGGSWSTPSRPRVDTHPLEPKLRFEAPHG